MRKTFSLSVIAVLFAALFSVSSCTKEDLVIPYDLGSLTGCIEPNQFQGYQTYSYDISHDDIHDALAAVGVTDMTKITKARLKSGLKASISATGVATNLDELASVEVYIKETGTQGDGTQVAYSPAIANGATEIELSMNGTELKDFITKDMTILVKILNKNSGNTKKACITFTNGIVDISAKK